VNPNSLFKRLKHEFFTFILKGEFFEEFLNRLKKLGYTTKYNDSILILASVPTGFGKPFPLRNLGGLTLLKSD
jgi:hypothetical protein